MYCRPLKKNVLVIMLLAFSSGFSQSYYAIHSSPYAGVSNMYVNPASTVNSFYKWDASLIGMQFKNSQTFFYVKNLSLTDPPKKFYDTMASVTDGTMPRYAHGVLDGQALSFRINLDSKTAIGVAFRGRMYNHLKMSSSTLNDSIRSLQNFLNANLGQQPLSLYGTHTAWTETCINFSRVLSQTSFSKWSAGINISFIKSISGVRAEAKNVTYTKGVNGVNGKTYYTLTGGSFSYMYSGNYSLFDSVKITEESAKDFYKSSHSSVGISIGAEYMVKNSYDGIELNNRNYDWKFGVAIMDFGSNIFDHKKGSASSRFTNTGVTDTMLEIQLKNIHSLTRFRDSFSRSFLWTDTLRSTFNASLPTRLVLSADRNLGNHFYVSGELTINFFSTSGRQRINTREIAGFNITPRYETQLLGFYLPVQYNSQGNLWVGAAFKIGPLIMGMHDLGMLGWAKQKDQNFNGGGYLLLNIYPYKNTSNDGLDCPKLKTIF